MKLIIAEKPELGRDIAKALFKDIKEQNGAIQEGDVVVTWAYGHLLEQVAPEFYDKRYKEWVLEDLPIYFENWKKEPSKDIFNRDGKVLLDNKYKRRRLQQIGEHLKKADVVIHAGDPDEEGQNLIDEILEYFDFKGEVKRVFVNDNITKNIVKAFDKLFDNSEMLGIGNSAYARQMADLCHGINHSRLAGLKLKRNGLSIGRVQTATLGLVVARDNAIIDHVVNTHYSLNSLFDLKAIQKEYKNVEFRFKPNKELIDEDKLILDKSVLENINILDGKCDTTIEERLTPAPLPYNQTLLSADMNKKYGYSLKKTLDITQVLRDKYKAITYNRSDSQYLKEEHFLEAPSVIPIVLKNINETYDLDLSIKSKCFNDENAPTHHGIIPQEKELNLSVMSEEERNVYCAIADRYLMQFMKQEQRMASVSVITHEAGVFTHTSSKVIEKGWKTYFTEDKTIDTEEKEEDNELWIDEGLYDSHFVSKSIKEKKTKPLAKYTEGTLVKDMTSISKYVKDSILKQALKDKDKGKKGENGSIGTVATRGSILETLFKRQFVIKEGKNIVSTSLGKEFYALIPNEIKTADITAKWWLIQEEIKGGNKDVNELMLDVVKQFNDVKEKAYCEAVLTVLKEEIKVLGACPLCGGNVHGRAGAKGKYWLCDNTKDNCSFRLYEYMERFKDTIKLSDTKIKKLLDGKEIEANLTSKSGKPYPALLKLKMNGKYANFELSGIAAYKKNEKRGRTH